MNYYVPFAIVCILLTLLFSQRKNSSHRLFIVTMTIAFVFAAIRYEFGPDWFSYYEIFNQLKDLGVKGYLSRFDHSEPLFIEYFSLFPSYTLFLATNSFFWFGLYTLFFTKFVDEKYYWFVLLLLFFDINCILNNLVAMRQAISSFLFIAAFFILYKNGYSKKGKLYFFLIMVVCSLFHTSCLLLIPLVFINQKRKSLFFSSWYVIIVILLSLITLFLGRHFITTAISGVLVQNVEELQRYEAYLDTFNNSFSDSQSLIRYFILIVLSIIPLFFIIYQGKKEQNSTYITIYKLGIIIATIGCIMGGGIMSRYMMILNPFYIAALTRSLSSSNSKPLNALVVACVSFASIYSFYHYLQADYCVSFLTYQTVFSAPSIP